MSCQTFYTQLGQSHGKCQTNFEFCEFYGQLLMFYRYIYSRLIFKDLETCITREKMMMKICLM